jgi:hypothetical protein
MAEEYVTALDPQRQTLRHVLGHEFYKLHQGKYIKVSLVQYNRKIGFESDEPVQKENGVRGL